MSTSRSDRQASISPLGPRPLAGALVLAAMGVALVVLRDHPALHVVLHRVVHLGLAIAPAALVVGSCAVIGAQWWPAQARQELSSTERALFGGIAVASAVSMVAFMLGVTGLGSRGGFVTLAAGLGLGACASLVVAWRGRADSPHPNNDSRPWHAGDLALVVLIALAALPVAVSVFAPPLLYDVTEYHLGTFRDFTAEGGYRIVPTPHNFYGRFPFPVEMLYHYALFLGGQRGDFGPKLVNAAAIVALAALLENWLKRWQVGRSYRLLALLLLLTHPVLLEVSLDAYIDGPVALLVTATLYGLILASGLSPSDLSGPTRRALWWPLAAIAGTMLAAKYTTAQLYLLPILLAFAGPAVATLRRLSRMQLLGIAALFLAPLALWLGKNVAFYANPLEPFFTWLFRPTDTAARAREAFYIAAHYPQSPLELRYWQTLVPRLEAVGWLHLAPMVGIGLIWRRPAVRHVVVVAVLSYLSWNLVRYSQDRFILATIFLVIMLVCSIIQALPSALARRVSFGGLVLASAMGAVPHTWRVASGGEFEYFASFEASDAAAQRQRRFAFYRKNLGALGQAVENVATTLPAEARLLLVYEARPYLFRHWTIYNTVFDDSELLRLVEGAQSADEVTTKLLHAGITHVLVNVEELRRFISQYARPEQLRAAGIEDAVAEFPRLATPEDLYPPFYRCAQWPRLRPVVIEWLRRIERQATFRAGHEAVPIFVTPLR